MTEEQPKTIVKTSSKDVKELKEKITSMEKFMKDMAKNMLYMQILLKNKLYNKKKSKGKSGYHMFIKSISDDNNKKAIEEIEKKWDNKLKNTWIEKFEKTLSEEAFSKLSTDETEEKAKKMCIKNYKKDHDKNPFDSASKNWNNLSDEEKLKWKSKATDFNKENKSANTSDDTEILTINEIKRCRKIIENIDITKEKKKKKIVKKKVEKKKKKSSKKNNA